ncbi:unnamed protein product, partial [Polarella glacialis]
ELFAYCRDGNFREVRAIAVHFPYILSLTDAAGFSALHHAGISGDPVFFSQVLSLYRDPRTFVLKSLMYESEEELLEDIEQGFQVCTVAAQGSDDSPVKEGRVRSSGQQTKAEEAGVMPGDVLEACTGTAFMSYRQPPPSAPDVLNALRAGRYGSFGFPVTLDFRGSAAIEILCKDGWTPSHAAAGRGCRGDHQILMQLLSEEDSARLAQDIIGLTAGHWAHLNTRSTAHAHRRPLSAGPRGAVRRPVSAVKQKEAGDPSLKPRPTSALRQQAEVAARHPPSHIEQAANAASGPSGPCLSRPMTPANGLRASTGSQGSRSIGATARDLKEMMRRGVQTPGGVDLLVL